MTKDNSTGKDKEFYSRGKQMFDNIEVIPTERKGKHMSNTGGPAFPCDLTAYDREVVENFQGMTLRDYFAAKAMQGMLAYAYFHPLAMEDGYARDAYVMADAMLKARGTT